MNLFFLAKRIIYKIEGYVDGILRTYWANPNFNYWGVFVPEFNRSNSFHRIIPTTGNAIGSVTAGPVEETLNDSINIIWDNTEEPGPTNISTISVAVPGGGAIDTINMVSDLTFNETSDFEYTHSITPSGTTGEIRSNLWLQILAISGDPLNNRINMRSTIRRNYNTDTWGADTTLSVKIAGVEFGNSWVDLAYGSPSIDILWKFGQF